MIELEVFFPFRVVKHVLESTEIPDCEITVACTNVIETLNFLRSDPSTGMKINVFSVGIKA